MTEKMKTTAPISSVGADGAQPQLKNYNEIIANETAQINLQAAQNPEKSGSGGLQTVSMTELYDTLYPPRTPVVDGFLYGGTYLFVGAPKVGKSFFMGQLAYHVAMGLPLWDYPVRKGTVLYLALEDDYARLQRRLSGTSPERDGAISPTTVTGTPCWQTFRQTESSCTVRSPGVRRRM